MRCASHILHLIVLDVLNDKQISTKIAKCRAVCKKLRTPNILVIIQSKKLNRPKIDLCTRWDSTFEILKRLRELKYFCIEFSSVYEFLHLTETLWNFVDVFLDIFESIHKTTIQLQKQNLIFGYFFKLWIEMKINLSENRDHVIKKLLLESIAKREPILLNNPAFCAAIYLDPRFNFILFENSKEIAQAQIKMVVRAINGVERNNGHTNSTD